MNGLTTLLERYASGDRVGAVEFFLDAITGPDGKRFCIDALGQAAIDQFVADADDAFESDMPSLLAWDFGEEQGKTIRQPAVFVLGACSDETVQGFLASLGLDASGFRMFGQVAELLGAWMPQLERVTLPGLNHGLELQDLDAVTAVVVDFVAQHPIG